MYIMLVYSKVDIFSVHFIAFVLPKLIFIAIVAVIN